MVNIEIKEQLSDYGRFSVEVQFPEGDPRANIIFKNHLPPGHTVLSTSPHITPPVGMIGKDYAGYCERKVKIWKRISDACNGSEASFSPDKNLVANMVSLYKAEPILENLNYRRTAFKSIENVGRGIVIHKKNTDVFTAGSPSGLFIDTNDDKFEAYYTSPIVEQIAEVSLKTDPLHLASRISSNILLWHRFPNMNDLKILNGEKGFLPLMNFQNTELNTPEAPDFRGVILGDKLDLDPLLLQTIINAKGDRIQELVDIHL